MVTPKGDIIATMTVPIQNIHTLDHLEAIAIVKGMELARDLALQVFCIQSDCQSIVNRINHPDPDEDLSYIGHVIHMLRGVINNPSCLGEKGMLEGRQIYQLTF